MWKLLVLVVICLLAGFGVLIVRAQLIHDRNAGPAASAPFPGVGALGRLEPQSEVLRINAPSALEPAVVREVCVNVGDPVESGQILAILDSRQRELADVELARADLEHASAALAKVLSGAKPGEIAAQAALVERTRAGLELAARQLERARKLVATNAMTADDLDLRESEVTMQQRELLHQEELLAAIRDIRQVDVDLAQAEVRRANASLQRAEADLELSVIRSPMIGRVLKITARPGERMSSDGLLELGDTRCMHVVAEVHEADILRIRVGQPCEVLLKSPGETLQGHVCEIGQLVGRKDVLSNDPVDDTDARVVEVRIRLSEQGSRLVAGLSFARVEVRIDTREESAP